MSAPAIFQSTMKGLLKGIPLVVVYLDDILVSREEEADHLKPLCTEWMHKGFTLWRRKLKPSWMLPLPQMSQNSKHTWGC